MTDLAEPGDVRRFPQRTLAPGSHLYRIHHRSLGPFWYSSRAATDQGGGRFDLQAPHGSSYWALRPQAAFLETVARRPIRVIPLEWIDRLQLSTVALPNALTAANSPVQRARGFGLTAEFHTTTDYPLTRRWAHALHRAGHRSLIAIPRHDVTASLRSITLFGRAGEHTPTRWRHALQTTDIPPSLLDAMMTWGIRCLPIPVDVPTVKPPQLSHD
jgi:hypothetical protein